MTTDRKLVAAASALLDSGGEDAVTLRAVGQAAGVSHNAPYRHFQNRDALLAAVATDDFRALADTFAAIGRSAAEPVERLMRALGVVVDCSIAHPARYRLLFNDPGIAARGGALGEAAAAAFAGFVAIVGEAQTAGRLPDVPAAVLAGLLFATTHGLVGLEASGRMHAEKGLSGVVPSLELLIGLLRPAAPTPPRDDAMTR